jgi:outer membrane protein assembly factor BamD (BamD/ComL family)
MEDSETIFKSAMALYQEANALRNRGDFNGAIERFQKVHSIDPDFDQHFRYADFYNDWGKALSSAKRYPEAIEKFEKAINIEPDNGHAFSAIAEALLAMGNNEASQSFFEKASQAYSAFRGRNGGANYAEYFYYDWALTELRLGLMESAISQFENSMRVRPDFPEPYAALSALYKHLGNIEKAETFRQQALKMNEQTVASVVPVIEAILAGSKNDTVRNAGIQSNGRIKPQFSGYHPDTTSGEDHLSITPDVNMLCDLIMASSWSPPLSIGLFGDWGTGKSFFMDKMKKRIEQIDIQSSRAFKTNTKSLYSRDVIQVTYNAWQYQDSNVFASIASLVFESIAKKIDGQTIEEGNKKKKAADQQEVMKKLFGDLNITREQIESHVARQRQVLKLQGELNEQITTLKEKKTSLFLDLKDLKNCITSDLLDQIRNDESVKKISDNLSKELGFKNEDKRVDKLIEDAIRTSRNPASRIFSFFKLPTKDKLITLGVIALFALASYFITQEFLQKLGTLAGSALGVIAGVVTSAISIIRPFIKKIQPLYKAAEKRFNGKISSLEIELQHQDELVKSTEQSLHSLTETANNLQSQIDDIQQGSGLSGFLHTRAASADYREKRGMIATVRDDFEELSNKLPNGLDQDMSKRIERIIMYIDDLDRCDPDRVVNVLEAVHLFMSIKNMVVVVAVDPRWLHNALWVHLDRFARAHESHHGKNDDYTFIGQTATPQNYLEKIFQIPFTLRPMSKEGFSSLITNMMSHQEKAAESTEQLPNTISIKQPSTLNSSQSITKQISSTNVPYPAEKIFSNPNITEPSVDLMPQNLEVSEKEIKGLASMSPMIETPRAAKRMVNIYRLIRTTLDTDELDTFIDREFEIVQFLLAVLIGCPEQADQFFTLVMKTESVASIDSIISKSEENDTSLIYVRNKVLKTWTRQQLNAFKIQLCKRWIPAVARFSFETESTVFKL